MEKPTPRSWQALVLTLPEGQAEEIAAVLAGGRLGVQFHEAAIGATRVHVYLREPYTVDQALTAAQQVLEGYKLNPSSCELHIERVEDGHWVERYQASLQPFDLGQGFVVWPAGSGPRSGERVPLKLVPGRAFGTGEHPTTQTCTEQLEQHVRSGSRWLDLGCGTGILSLVAWHVGATEVLGCDLDPVAVDVARETAQLNGNPSGVTFRVGSATEPPSTHPFDGVVCNISASFLLTYGREVAAMIVDGGLLIASGFLVEDIEQLLGQFSQLGLRELARVERPPWAVLVLERSDSVRVAAGRRHHDPPAARRDLA